MSTDITHASELLAQVCYFHIRETFNLQRLLVTSPVEGPADQMTEHFGVGLCFCVSVCIFTVADNI